MGGAWRTVLEAVLGNTASDKADSDQTQVSYCCMLSMDLSEE